MNHRQRWYDCRIAVIDGRSVYLAFQINPRLVFFRDKDRNQLRAAIDAFMVHIVLHAARRLPRFTYTSRHGVRHYTYSVKREYNVYKADYNDFVRAVTEMLTIINLPKTCGMIAVRFYTCKHGLRLNKTLARFYTERIVDKSHPHVDVLQLHVADELHCRGDDDAPLFVRLSGGR